MKLHNQDSQHLSSFCRSLRRGPSVGHGAGCMVKDEDTETFCDVFRRPGPSIQVKHIVNMEEFGTRLSPLSSTALEENSTYHRVRVHKIGFTMLLVESFGSDAFFEQLRCAAGWNTFQNIKLPPATHSTATRLFCSGRSKMWSHTADSTCF